MRILQVSRIFEPLLTAQAIAVAKSACAIHEAGARVDVLCGHAFKEFKAAPWTFPAPYHAIRVESAGYRPKDLMNIARTNPLFPPTPWALEAAARYARAPGAPAHDVVFATFGPVDSLQAARAIAKRKNLPLILEFNDPFPYALQEALFEDKDPLVVLYRQWYTESWMRALMPVTQAYVVPATRMKTALVAYLESRGRADVPVRVVPHVGWGREGGPVRRGRPRLVMAHLGAFYSRKKKGKQLFIRCALPLLRALDTVLKESPDAADSLELRFVGGLDTPSREFVAEKGLGNRVVVEPPVEYAASLEKMHEADVLLLLEEEMPSSPFLPAKFADYIITRKPILSLSPPQSEVGDIMTGRFGVLVNIHNTPSIADGIRKTWRMWKEGTLDALRVPESVVQRFTGASIGRGYLEAFEDARLWHARTSRRGK